MALLVRTRVANKRKPVLDDFSVPPLIPAGRMDALLTPLFIAASMTVLGLAANAAPPETQPAQTSIPYVASRHDAVEDMLWMADVGKEDVVYDLGSGDGRIVIAAVRDFNARRAVGVEIDERLVRESRKNAANAGVADRVEFVHGDLFAADLEAATVVTLFLGHEANLRLRPKLLRSLKPGTRIVSHQFGMGEWQTDKALQVRSFCLGMYGTLWRPFSNNPRVPDFTGNEGVPYSRDVLLLWVVPAPVAGVWHGELTAAEGRREITLALRQRLSTVTGTFRIDGETPLTGNVRAELWGDHLRWECVPQGMAYGVYQLRFDGHVEDRTMKGTLAVVDHGQASEAGWQARREQTDFAGRWEWCWPDRNAVSVRIERREGNCTATYTDGKRTIPVPDLYDHGGGFYFTLKIGYGAAAELAVAGNSGWLLAEGIVEDGQIKGTTEFHQDTDLSGVRKGGGFARPVARSWTPRRVQ